MKKYKVTKQKVLKFSAEMEEEASVKMAIAKVCDVKASDIRIVMGGRDTISQKIKNKMITPEILYAMEKAIISILIKRDLDDAYNGITAMKWANGCCTKVRDTGTTSAIV